MRPGERPPQGDSGVDEFGDDTDSFFFDGDDAGAHPAGSKLSKSDRQRMAHARHRRHVRRGRLAIVLVIVLAAVLTVGGYFGVGWLTQHYFSVRDYSGSGYGSVQVTIPSGASASDIGDILHSRGVVASTEAFTDAASKDSRSQGIQPGTYRLNKHMSGTAALAMLLDPRSRDSAADVVVPEGATTLAVRDRLVRLYGPAKAPVIDTALRDPRELGVPTNYRSGSRPPRTVEGFLYPATYSPPPDSTPVQTLQAMVTRFIAQDRQTNFAGDATRLHLTPYQALTIASIAQAEAKFGADMPKVTRTILNRIKAGMPLQSDSTSAYGCALRHIRHCIYSQLASPYNSYRNKGLPPSPIDNPGAPAMHAAVHPATGNWLYFVTIDSAGHLGFFHTAAAFSRAARRCAKNNWGCAG